MGFPACELLGVRPARDVIERSIDNALASGLYGPSGGQVGFARVVADRARFAWLSDVFVLDEHRGRGVGGWLIETVLSYPDLDGTRVMLGTSDAHGLYERFGFAPADPSRNGPSYPYALAQRGGIVRA